MTHTIQNVDPDIAQLIEKESQRQNTGLELIASENFASQAVRMAQASILTNKYAEGYPGKRYYGGCALVDEVETLAIERAKALFQAEHANVQPHSGSQANMAVLMALVQPNDTIMGMDLAHGGHLTHGSPVSFSGKSYRFIHYGVDRETGRIDYDQVMKLAKEHQPKLIIAGASAYPRTIDFSAFAKAAKACNALFMVDMAHIAGLVAAGQHPSPFPQADVVTTTTHKTLRGPRGGIILTKKELAKKINSAVFPGIQGGPLMHVIASKAIALKEASMPSFADYQKQVIANARGMAETFEQNGIPMVSGGTDNHLILLDLTSLEITGAQAETVLEQAGITTNKNSIPFDSRPPSVTSGIRLGTPAITTRGMQTGEAKIIARLISALLKKPEDSEIMNEAKKQVDQLCKQFPLNQ